MRSAVMDAATVLRDQHAGIRRAIIRAAWPGGERDAEFRRLVRMLAQHEAAEEAHVHPTIRRAARRGIAVARVSEERHTKRLLARLQQTGPHGLGYLLGLGLLGWHVVRHAAREEREEFPVLSRLSPVRRWTLAGEIYLARALAPSRPHPKVNGELANKLAMPVLGPADRVRDIAARRAWTGRSGE
jgi:Hemerythrin HHE cation binding domain